MGNIVWLASYPRSGNTWTRAFLTHYLGERPDELDINRLEGGPIASARSLFDLATGVESSCLSRREIEDLRGDAFRHLARRWPGTSFFKTHEKYSLTESGGEIFPREVTRAVIYLVRNPLDVAVSAAHHFSLSLQESVELLSLPSRSLSRGGSGISEQLPQLLGTWSEHAISWIEGSGLPVCAIRYEDMLANPGACFGSMLHHIGIEVDPERVRQSVEAVSFERLKRQEGERGFRERPFKSSAPFFRSGRQGSWRDVLNARQIAAILTSHQEIMQRFEYASISGRPL